MRAEGSLALRVIDFVNVTGEKKFCCSVHGANCDSVGLLHQKCYVSSTPFDTSGKAQWSRRETRETVTFASRAARTVYFWFALSNFSLVRSAVSNAEAHIPTQPSSPVEDARISFSYEDQERPGGDFPPSCQGTQARCRKAWFPRVVDLNLISARTAVFPAHGSV